MKDEFRSIEIYNELIRKGYLVFYQSNRWVLTEPETRKLPQRIIVSSMLEAERWMIGVESIRFILHEEIRKQGEPW